MKHKFGLNDVKLLAKKCLYQGFFKIEEYRFQHRLFAGGWSGEICREVFERGNAVVVLPYDPLTDQVILIEQIRIPAISDTDSPWLFEVVAGMVDKGQAPQEVAHRELAEETGLQAVKMQKINQYFSSPGGTSEQFDFYYAQVEAPKSAGVFGLADEHEDIQVHVVSRQAAYEMVVNGQINNASTVIALQWLQLNYSSLATT